MGIGRFHARSWNMHWGLEAGIGMGWLGLAAWDSDVLQDSARPCLYAQQSYPLVKQIGKSGTRNPCRTDEIGVISQKMW